MFVYVVGASESGPTKVGIATDIRKRLKFFSTHSPDEIKLFHSVECSSKEVPIVEAYAHCLLGKQRIRGEWFDATAEDCKQAVDLALRMVNAGIHNVLVKQKLNGNASISRPMRDWSSEPVRNIVAVKNFPRATWKTIAERARANGLRQGEWLGRAILAYAGAQEHG